MGSQMDIGSLAAVLLDRRGPASCNLSRLARVRGATGSNLIEVNTYLTRWNWTTWWRLKDRKITRGKAPDPVAIDDGIKHNHIDTEAEVP